jgi:hypothetical protein
VLAALADHLWQSILVLVLVAVCAALTRRNSARVRLWLWRIGALKFAVPFALLVATGDGIGLSGRKPDDPVPVFLLDALNSALKIAAPVRTADVDGVAAFACVVLLLLVTLTWARVLIERERLERWRVAREIERLERDPDDSAPGLGLWRGALFTLLALNVAGMPMFAGAIEDRQWRRELVLENARTLRHAEISIRPAAHGMGSRVKLIANADGVRIRNATVQELAGLAYGLSTYVVWAEHRVYDEEFQNDWFAGSRYDVDIRGRIREPDEFDAYALRVPITELLAEKYGLEIHQNGACQPPCGKYGVPIPESLP